MRDGRFGVIWNRKGIYRAEPAVSADGRIAVISWKEPPKGHLEVLSKPGPQPIVLRTIDLKKAPAMVRPSSKGDRLIVIEARYRQVQSLNANSGEPGVQLQHHGFRRFWNFGWLHGDEHVVGLVSTGEARGFEGSEECVVLWDSATGEIVRQTVNPTAMDVLAVSPDGRRFVEAGADKCVRVRDPDTLAVLQEFRAHDGAITAIAWQPGSDIVATASDDLTIRLWDLKTGSRLQTLRGPLVAPHTLNFSPSGHRLACAGPDGVTRIWQLK